MKLIPFALALTAASAPVRAERLELQGAETVHADDASALQEFGAALDATPDLAVVGAQDAAYVLARNQTSWTQETKLAWAPGDGFGSSVAIDGQTIVVGAPEDDHSGGTDAGSATVYVRDASGWSVQQQLLASDAEAEDAFGSSVTLCGDTVLVGAPEEDSVEPDAGAVYVFVRSGSTWSEEAKLLAPDGRSGDRFGTAVALDDDTALIGAPFDQTLGGIESGSAYVFVRNDSNWNFQEKFTDTWANVRFGRALDIDGDRALITKRNTVVSLNHTVHSYVRVNGQWSLEHRFRFSSSAEDFGASVHYADGLALIGAPGADDACQSCNSGAAYLLRFNGDVWRQQARFSLPTPALGDRVGAAVVLAGSQALLGAPGDDGAASDAGSVHVANLVPSGLSTIEEIDLSDISAIAGGDSVGVSGDTVVVADELDPAAWVFARTASSWTLQAEIGSPQAGVDFTSLQLDGDTLAIGSESDDSFTGAAYVFERSGTRWSQTARLVAVAGLPGHKFGTSIDLDADRIVVGAPFESHGGLREGSAYVFVRSGLLWVEEARLEAFDAGSNEFFGWAVALSGDTLAVSAPNAALTSSSPGALYVYVRSAGAWSLQQRITVPDTPGDVNLGPLVALEGDTLAVSSGTSSASSGNISRAAYVFTRQGTSWTQEARIEQRICALDVSHDRLVLGDPIDIGSGSAVIYARRSGGWEFERELFARNAQVRGFFGESVSIDQDVVAVGALGFVFRLAPLFPSFCDATDVSLAFCPCEAPGAQDTGCENAQHTGGVGLTVLKQETQPAPRATVIGTGFPTTSQPPVTLIRGASLVSPGPVVFGDGLRCVASPIVRLAATAAIGGTSTHTFGHGTMAASGKHYYQLWFRNTPAMFCTPEAFNLSSGRVLEW